MKYYIYTHTRIDNGQVFYVGKSTINNKGLQVSHISKYRRAYDMKKRSKYWNDVYKLTDCQVNIEFETDIEKEAHLKEIELIKHFGRSVTNNGPLVNISKGGKGGGGPQNRNIRVTQLTLDGDIVKVWDQVKDIQNETGYLKTNIVKCCRKKQLTAYGYLWTYTDNNSFKCIKPSASRRKPFRSP